MQDIRRAVRFRETYIELYLIIFRPLGPDIFNIIWENVQTDLKVDYWSSAPYYFSESQSDTIPPEDLLPSPIIDLEDGLDNLYFMMKKRKQRLSLAAAETLNMYLTAAVEIIIKAALVFVSRSKRNVYIFTEDIFDALLVTAKGNLLKILATRGIDAAIKFRILEHTGTLKRQDVPKAVPLKLLLKKLPMQRITNKERCISLQQKDSEVNNSSSSSTSSSSEEERTISSSSEEERTISSSSGEERTISSSSSSSTAETLSSSEEDKKGKKEADTKKSKKGVIFNKSRTIKKKKSSSSSVEEKVDIKGVIVHSKKPKKVANNSSSSNSSSNSNSDSSSVDFDKNLWKKLSPWQQRQKEREKAALKEKKRLEKIKKEVVISADSLDMSLDFKIVEIVIKRVCDNHTMMFPQREGIIFLTGVLEALCMRIYKLLDDKSLTPSVQSILDVCSQNIELKHFFIEPYLDCHIGPYSDL